MGPLLAWRKALFFVDHTTVSAAVTRALYEAAETREIAFVDAPISGGQAGAENGQLSVMCGGDIAPYEKAEPIIAAYAKMCRRIGESGAGQMTKMCNQLSRLRAWCRDYPRRSILRKRRVLMAPLWLR